MTDLAQLMVEALGGTDEGGVAPTVDELLDRYVDTSDPATAAIVRAFRARAAGTSEVAPESDIGDDPEVADVLQRMYEELELLRARDRALADALGACPRCWGDAPDCAVCHGRGAPGGRRPDEARYAQFVVPAQRRYLAAPLDPALPDI